MWLGTRKVGMGLQVMEKSVITLRVKDYTKNGLYGI